MVAEARGGERACADALPEPPRAGLTSAAADAAIPEAFYRTYGFHVCGPRAVRLDILERLADLIRPLLAWRANPDNPGAVPPKGATGDGGFTVTPEMMSILGCSTEELGAVLKALGFRLERRPLKTPPAPRQSETAAAPPGAAATGAELGLAADAGGAGEVGGVQIAEAEAAAPQRPTAAGGCRGQSSRGRRTTPPSGPPVPKRSTRPAEADASANPQARPPRRPRPRMRRRNRGGLASATAPAGGERRPPRRATRPPPGARTATAQRDRAAEAGPCPHATPTRLGGAGAPHVPPQQPPQGGVASNRGMPAGIGDRKPSRGPQQPLQQRRKSEDRGRGPDRRVPRSFSPSPRGARERGRSPFAKLGALREALERRS